MPSVRGAPTGPLAMATACLIGNRRLRRPGMAPVLVLDTVPVRDMVLAPAMALAQVLGAVAVEIIMKPVL
jgi:hypothetical protein